MLSVSDRAIVLTRLDYSETSQIVVFMTRDHGKIRAIAKGIKRGTKTRFVTGTDLLDVGEIVVVTREERSAVLATLTEWKHTRSLLGLREKLTRIHAGQYCAEITAALTEDWDPHAELFDALFGALVELADADEVIGAVVRYQAALLESIGSMPRFDGCIGCGRADEITHFSSHEGGVICRHCEPGRIEKRGLSRATLDVLRALLQSGLVRERGPYARTDSEPQASGCANERTRALSGSLNVYVGPFDILDYHLTQMMGRPSVLSEKLVPSTTRRTL